MTLYLLDTNAVADLMRDPSGPVAQRLTLVGAGLVCTSVIVAAEIRYGAAKRASARLSRRVDQALKAIPVQSFEPPVDRIYGDIRNALESLGTPIGDRDLLIAAHALALGCIIVTDNEDEFRRVPGLQVENWQRSN